MPEMNYKISNDEKNEISNSVGWKHINIKYPEDLTILESASINDLVRFIRNLPIPSTDFEFKFIKQILETLRHIGWFE